MAAEMAALCSTLLFVGLFVFVSADNKPITAESGQNVILPCRTPNYINIMAVEWSRDDLKDEHVLLYRDGWFEPNKQHPSFKNRVDLQDRQMKDGDVSVILKNVTVNDTGTYECRVIQSGTNNDPISTIPLRVVAPPPPGPTGGRYGLIVGLSVFVLLLLLVAAGFLLSRKQDKKSQSVRTETDDAELQSDQI